MPKSERIRTLEACIKRHLVPLLSVESFKYYPKTRTFCRGVERSGCTQIVYVQVGVRSCEGEFTVNLGVFYPDFRERARSREPRPHPREYECLWPLRERLARFRSSWLNRIARSLIRDPTSWWQYSFVTPRDRWWKFSSNEAQTSQSILSVQAASRWGRTCLACAEEHPGGASQGNGRRLTNKVGVRLPGRHDQWAIL